MSRRGAGITFIAISALFYITRYISAGLYLVSFDTGSWNSEIFSNFLAYVDQGLTSLSIAALIIGIVYLVWAEVASLREGRRA